MTNVPVYQLFIDNAFLPSVSGETFDSVNPYNGQVIAKLARGNAVDIDKAVKAARRAFDEGSWSRLSAQERCDFLVKLSEALEAQSAEFVALMVAESGSTVRKAKGEVWQCVKQLAYFGKQALTLQDEALEKMSKPGVSHHILVREPIGVCGQITPWNFPLQMPIWKLGPALAAGNTVVLKPAEETSAIVMKLAELIAKVNFPPGVINIVTGFGEEAGGALSEHPGVDKIAFTGSTEVGKLIMQQAAPTLKKVTLELGGKSANIVFDDADLNSAVDAAVFAAFFHAGQCCTAGTRLLVQEGIYDKFIAEFSDKASRIRLGDPADKATEMGPLISDKQQARVSEYIAIGEKEGAKSLVKTSAPSQGAFVGPTVFVNVDNHMKIAQEEIFGPVVCVLKFKTAEEAVKIANDSPYGLAGAVWSQDEEKALKVARQLRAGTVWVNEYHLISEKAPFGGYKQSGLGRELGAEGLYEYTELKHIHVDELKARDKKFWYDAVVPAAPVAP